MIRPTRTAAPAVAPPQAPQEKRKQRIKPSSAKAKGRAFQQMICAKISELTGFEWGADKPIESRPMGQNGTDVRMESQVLPLFPFSVECKCQESWSVPGWVAQAKVNVVSGTDWLLFCKRSRQPPVVVMDVDVFFELMKKVNHDKGINHKKLPKS